MSTIKPFCSVLYNKEKVGDPQRVMAPPYDVISEELQAQLQARSPYNFTHIDLIKDVPEDNDQKTKYDRASDIFQKWLQDEVMVQDSEPAIYVYRQEYTIMGQKHNRLGFVAAMALEDEGDSRVRPHEKTHDHHASDRLELTKALDANLSPIFVCYSDTHRKVEKIYTQQLSGQEPLFDVTGTDGVRNKVWRVTDKAEIEDINRSLTGQQLFIADGHHRYRVAQEYRQLCKEKAGENYDPDAAYNYVMTYFTNLDSRDLQIFPMHRIVPKISKSLDFLEDIFRIDRISSKEELPILLAKAGLNEHAFALYTKEGMKLLRLKNKLMIEERIKEGSVDFKHLDATILKNFVFDQLGIEPKDIIYTKDQEECFQMVDEGKADASFIMNAVRIQQLKAIALNGERMPQKTTYFFPKVMSGLTVYKMD